MISAVSAASVPASAGHAGGAAPRAGARATPELSEAEQRTVEQLQQRDREVRAHEQAHIAAGGGLITSGASYTYQLGPDNKRYAIGGEVGIDTSPGSTPEETLAKAERIRAAALAPASPSAQDFQVAATADRMAMEARLEINSETATDGPASSRQGEALSRMLDMLAGGPSTGTAVDTYA